MAKRQGRKSAAQTPAPKKDRIYGSKKNPKGSASSEKTASKIKVSQSILKGLEKKLKEFREKYPSKKNVTLADLKAVFRRGAGAFSKSYRPFITGGAPNSRNAWAYARVNKFLKKAAGQKVKAAYVQDDDLLKREDGGEVFARGGLIAPNGKKSNLTPEQYKLVRTLQFKAWFGDWENDPDNASKVVDENGEPLVVYHGTSKDFNVFQKSKDEGIYFTDSYDMSIEYAELSKGNILLSVFLNLRKPKVIDANEGVYDKELMEEVESLVSVTNEGVVVKYVDEQGLGVISTIYIVKNPTQIKLADGSNATFDGDNPDIRYAEGGQTFNDKELLAKGGEILGIKYTISKGESDDERIVTFEEGQYRDVQIETHDAIFHKTWGRMGGQGWAHIKEFGFTYPTIREAIKSYLEDKRGKKYPIVTKKEGGLIGGFEDLTDEWLSKKIEIFLYKVKPIKFYFVDPNTNTLTIGFDKYYSQDAAQKVYEEAISSKEFFHAPSLESTYDSKTGDLVFKIKLKKAVEYSKGGNIVYSAIFFDENEIVKRYGQVLPNLYSHHSTIEFKPQSISDLPIGDRVNISIIGRLTTDKVDVLLVNNPFSKNKYPHITLSTSEGVKPFESNKEIEQNINKVKPLNDYLEGVVGYFDGSRDITKYNDGGEIYEDYEDEYDEPYPHPSSIVYQIYHDKIKLDSDTRYVLSNEEKITFNDVKQDSDRSYKPKGLWYAFGSGWAEYTFSNMPNRANEYHYLHKIEVNDNVLRLDTKEKCIQFTEEYSTVRIYDTQILLDISFEVLPITIDWVKVAKKYSGIEVTNPREWSFGKNSDRKLFWLYGWDVPSGCIWNQDGIKSIKLLYSEGEEVKVVYDSSNINSDSLNEIFEDTGYRPYDSLGQPHIFLIEENKIIGCLFLNDKIYFDERSNYEFDIVIKADKRGKGYAKLLLDEMINDFVSNFKKSKEIQANLINDELSKYLIRKYGFKCIGGGYSLRIENLCLLSRKKAIEYLKNNKDTNKKFAKGGEVKDFDKTFIDSLSNDIIYHTDAIEQGAWMDYDEPESVSIKNVKKFINKIFNTEWNNGGLKNIPETLKLYRVVFLNDEKELKTDFLGYHWVRDEKLVKTHITDMMGQFNLHPAHKNMQYMIIADFKKDDIDIYWTVYNNVSVDHEEEVTIKKDAKPIKYKLVKFFAKGGEIDPQVLRERWAKKKDALQNLANNIQRLRTNLSKDLREGDEKERLTALVVKVMDETGERVGNNVSADNGHFGVTGLKKKHIKVNGSNLKFKYTGKSGVEHEKEINDSTLANAMREAINNSPSEYVFETSDGFRIKNDRVNRYLNRFDVSAKDLRGYSANKWIITRLKSVKDREILGDAKKRKTKFNEIVKDVAEKVGHGRATLKKHYLLPSLEREFINHGKIVDLSNIKRTYEDGGEVNSPRSAKQQFATDLQEDKDFKEAKKRAIYDERGRTFGTPNVLINDPYVRKARYKHFKIDDSDINDDDIELAKGGMLKRLAPGFYEGIYKGVKFTITHQDENAYGGKPMWYFQIENGSVDDLFFTKAQTLEAVKYFIDNSSKYAEGGETKEIIALPDTYSQYERLKEILRNQGYDLTKNGMARGGKTNDNLNTGIGVINNTDYDHLDEAQDMPNDGEGIFDKGGKTQYKDGVSKLVNKESVEHLIPTFEEDDINWFKLIHSKDLINQLLENIGIPIRVKFELGEGANGTAWMTENDTVLKLTKNGAEAYSSYIIFKNQENFRSQAEIYNIFIINDYSKVDVQRIYFIEKQFLKTFQDSKASSISHIYNDIEATATATKYSNNDRLEMLENIIRDENLSEQESIYARQVFALAKDVDKEARAYGINLRDNHSGNVGFDNNGKLLCYDCAYLGNKKLNKGGNLKNKNMETMKVGGEISQEEKKEIYAKWKKLVNMSKSELQKFYDSEEGKQAGLTPEEAKEAGIDSGRESARWIMKMKDTKVADWTPTMWMWAKKQISFVSRMSGNKGKLVDENGKKTRKYLSLLIWGNDPKKKASGGDVEEPCHVCSMSDAQYQNLPALGEMADGKRFVYRESVFAKGGDTMSHVGDRYLILECMGEGGITDTLNLKVIQSSSPALLVGSTINRPIRNIINKGREIGTTFGEAITGNYKKGGELNPDNKEVKNYFEHKSGSAGGLLVGKRHSEGGIKAINNSTGQPLEMEGGEVVITRDAVSDPAPVTYEGKQMTKREVLSEINQSGGGVAFADGGVVGEKTA